MSNPSIVSLTLPALDADGISLSQTPLAAGNLTITGTFATGGVATLTPARRVAVASDGNDATRVFTIYGTDRNGNAQIEAITGVNMASVGSQLDFLTVTRVSVDAATAGAITVGTNGTGSTEWVLDNYLASSWALAIAVSTGGTVTYTVEATYDDPNKIGTSLVAMPEQFSNEPGSYVPARAWPKSDMTAKTADAVAIYDNHPIFAHRLTITAGTARATMQSIQAGIIS